MNCYKNRVVKNSLLIILFFSTNRLFAQETLPWLGKVTWVNGFSKAISGEQLSYYSAYPDDINNALLTRATDGHKTIEWETAPVPAHIKGPYVYFCWVAAHSTGTSGGSRHFDLYLGDKKLLSFTTEPANKAPDWSFVADDSTRIVFKQLRKDHSDDAHGLAYLRLPLKLVTPGQPVRLKMIGDAQNSNDWFMVFTYHFEEKVLIEPSPFLLKNGKQSFILHALHFGGPSLLTVRVNHTHNYTMPLHDGFSEMDIPVATVEKPDSVFIRVTAGKKVLANAYCTLLPAAHRIIYILPHSHFDLGYTDRQSHVEQKQIDNLLKGMEYARMTRNFPAGSRFVWNLEGTYAAWLLMHRMDSTTSSAFIAAVQKGEVAVNGMFLNTLTGLCRPEELLQLFQYSTELAKLTGKSTEAAMISDVPGYTWGTVAAMAQSGIKYFSVAPNYFDRIGDIFKQWEDKPFYWVSPSGKEKVLVWIPYKGYALSHGVPALSGRFIASYLDHLNTIHFPYDISYIRWSGHGDNAVPEIELSNFVRDWNSRYNWPKLVIASTTTAFKAFEKEYGQKIPVYKGDWTGYWEDGAGSSANETRLNRSASSTLTQAEILWAITKPDLYPADRFKEAWKNVLLFSEHTWGASESITNPLSQMTLDQWAIKQSFALKAQKQSDRLIQDALSLSSSINRQQKITVFNTAAYPSGGLVLVSKELTDIGNMVIDAKGNLLASQRLSTGELAFIAPDIPPFSAAAFSILKKDPPSMPSLNAGLYQLDNGLVQVQIDSSTGAISGIQRTGIPNNFALASGKYLINDYLFFPGNKPDDIRRNETPTIRIKEKGPCLVTLDIQSTAPGCKWLHRTVTITAGSNAISIVDEMDKKPAPLIPKPGDYLWANTGGKEAVHFAFPFHVPDGQIHISLPLAVIRPETDQIPGSCKNWLEVSDWADVSNAEMGITMVTPDAPLLEIGKISANLLGGQSDPSVWRKIIEPTQTLYSWAMNNHWETNYKASQEGIIRFRYLLYPHGKYDAATEYQLAGNILQPLIVSGPLTGDYTKPLVTISDKQLQVIQLKPSVDGKAWLITLLNPTTALIHTNIHWKQSTGSMHYSNTAEEQLAIAPEELPIEPGELITVRVERK